MPVSRVVIDAFERYSGPQGAPDDHKIQKENKDAFQRRVVFSILFGDVNWDIGNWFGGLACHSGTSGDGECDRQHDRWDRQMDDR